MPSASGSMIVSPMWVKLDKALDEANSRDDWTLIDMKSDWCGVLTHTNIRTKQQRLGWFIPGLL
ncbi:hypothetical protein OK016_26535 [Vibrio chagasii]|nr:hypothetical protein [Vibrio chagasii]